MYKGVNSIGKNPWVLSVSRMEPSIKGKGVPPALPCGVAAAAAPASYVYTARERERELRKEGREVPSRVRLREGPIGVRITLGQPTIG